MSNTNNRIYYATQAIGLRPTDDKCQATYGHWYMPRGVQSVGITTNFNLEQVFQLGSLEIYDNIEDVPEVEVTISKNIDGTAPLYLMCMGAQSGIAGASNKDMASLSTNRVHFTLAIYDDKNAAATGAVYRQVTCSGMYLSSISYNVPVEGVATEDVTLVGNSKLWAGHPKLAPIAPTAFRGFGSASEAKTTALASARRFKYNKTESVLPSGAGGGIPTGARVQNVKVSADLGREAILELGSMAPYFRYVKFPVEVTSEVEIIATEGDEMNADDFEGVVGTCATTYTNLANKELKIVICGSGASNKLAIDLGDKNKLTSVNYTGGDTGGGNATISYSYQTFNTLTVTGHGSFLIGLNSPQPPAPPPPPEG